MPTPDQMDMFDLLYMLAAADGRGEALLGGQREQLRSLYERTLIGSARPSLYLEFPLLGEPCYDFLSVIDEVESGATFAPGAGYGYQKAFDWFSTVCEDKGRAGARGYLPAATPSLGACGALLGKRR